jgi:YD repeat-containing protein
MLKISVPESKAWARFRGIRIAEMGCDRQLIGSVLTAAKCTPMPGIARLPTFNIPKNRPLSPLKIDHEKHERYPLALAGSTSPDGAYTRWNYIAISRRTSKAVIQFRDEGLSVLVLYAVKPA